jgi:hypothetical protein
MGLSNDSLPLTEVSLCSRALSGVARAGEEHAPGARRGTPSSDSEKGGTNVSSWESEYRSKLQTAEEAKRT